MPEGFTHPLSHCPNVFNMLKLTILSRVSLELYHPSLISPFPRDLKHLFYSSSLRFLSLQTLCLPAAPANPLSVSAGMTILLSGNLKFSCRFCVEPLDSFLRPPQLIIWLGLTASHPSDRRNPSPTPALRRATANLLSCKVKH